MGTALIRGVVSALDDTTVLAWDVRSEAMAGLPEQVVKADPDEWFDGAGVDAVVVVTKPQDLVSSLTPVAGKAGKDAGPLWISMAAGVSIRTLESVVGQKSRVCRVMPNTPALVGEGISAYAFNRACGDSDAALVERILGACGEVVAVPEKLMNAVTGLSGSGPAYVYLFIEALIEGGVSAGLPRATAEKLAAQTVRGAATLVLQSGSSPSELKAAVMSPGGTTVRGLIALEEHRMKYGVIQAVADATRRAEELDAG